MAARKTYIVEFATILAVGNPRERGVLSLKALAAYHGLPSTRRLSRYGVTRGYQAVSILENLKTLNSGFSSPIGKEPSHPSDNSASPVCLEAFCVSSERAETVLAERYMDILDVLVAEEEWMQASAIAVRALKNIHGYNRSCIVGYLETIAPFDSRAKIAYARALLDGDGIERDIPKAIAILSETAYDDDADVAGYSHLMLGNTVREIPGRAREAMRHYESAGNLGYDLGAEEAGVMLQYGCDEFGADVVRAARNFKTGSALGSTDCMVRLSVMILAGDIEYTPVWRHHYERALSLDDRNALDMYPLVLQARASSRDDPEMLVSHFCRTISETAI